MSTSYRAAVRTGLPHATIVVDHFHVVQLANKMLSTVRRRTTAPKWRARRRLLRNRQDLTAKQFTRMRNALMDAGQIGMTLLTAWIAKERLRGLLALARTALSGKPLRGSSVPSSTSGFRRAASKSASGLQRPGVRVDADSPTAETALRGWGSCLDATPER
ncbi:transposase [Streptomyces mirabilis]|uniref:transposase n=1 Tax=Streptomyces mirabilis TaxID=68239 RepID=UPI00399D6324